MDTILDLSEISKRFSDEKAARELIEKLRWPNAPICPHCGTNGAYKITPKNGSGTRAGLYKCKECRKQFTVTVNTIFEGSHIPLSKWLIAIHLICSSKKGMSALQLSRMLGVSYKSAWFMAHRVRHAMSRPPLSRKLRGIVEADETYVGGKGKGKRGRGSITKTPVFSLVERNGVVRSQPIADVKSSTLKEIMLMNVSRDAKVMTDDFPSYRGIDKHFREHGIVQHARKEYVRGNVHTNTAEGYFSLLKRGITGTFHHVSRHHLHRYCNEFDFRYNYRKMNDGERSVALIGQVKNKRLFYRDSSQDANQSIH